MNEPNDSLGVLLASNFIDAENLDVDGLRLNRALARRSRRRRLTWFAAGSVAAVALGFSFASMAREDPPVDDEIATLGTADQSETPTDSAPSPSAVMLALSSGSPTQGDSAVPASPEDVVRHADFVLAGTVTAAAAGGPLPIEVFPGQDDAPNGPDLVQVGITLTVDNMWIECACPDPAPTAQVFLPMWIGQASQVPESPIWSSQSTLDAAVGLDVVISGSMDLPGGGLSTASSSLFIRVGDHAAVSDESLSWVGDWMFDSFSAAIRDEYLNRS
jgi:hypothetical protein